MVFTSCVSRTRYGCCAVGFSQSTPAREARPDGHFDLVLCRNLVLTYFDDRLQSEILRRIIDTMADGAVLVIGIHEDLPEGSDGLELWFDRQRIYRKTN